MPDNVPIDTASIEAQILALGVQDNGSSVDARTPPPAAAPAEPARAEKPTGEHSADQSPPPARVRYGFTFPEPIWKHHRSRVLSTTDPEQLEAIVRDVEHIKEARGRQKGCQCWDCKSTRGEIHLFELPGDAAPSAIDPILSELLSEDLIGDILDAPNKAMAVVCQIRKLPKEIRDIWEPEAKRIELYGRYGKALVDRYLKLPDFQHKELIVFSTWYGLTLSGRIGMMVAMLKTMEATK